jgi:hypothetical protein
MLMLLAASSGGSIFRCPGRPSVKACSVASKLGAKKVGLAVELLHDANWASGELRQLADVRCEVVKFETTPLGIRDVPDVSLEHMSAERLSRYLATLVKLKTAEEMEEHCSITTLVSFMLRAGPLWNGHVGQADELGAIKQANLLATGISRWFANQSFRCQCVPSKDPVYIFKCIWA